MPERRILRPGGGTVWLMAVAVVVLLLLVDTFVRGTWQQVLLVAPWMLIPVWFVYVALWAPHLEIDEERVRVRNVLRTFELPWSSVADIRVRWQLEFHLKGDRATMAVGGRKGIVEAWSFSRNWGGAGRKRIDDTETTLDVMRELRALAGPQPGEHPAVFWNIPPLIAAGVITVGCALSLAFLR